LVSRGTAIVDWAAIASSSELLIRDLRPHRRPNRVADATTDLIELDDDKLGP